MYMLLVTLAWLVGVHDELVGTGRVYRVGTGRVYRVGNTGYPAPRQVQHPQGHPDSEAGPGSPRGWSGWSGWPSPLDRWAPAVPGTTLRARSVPLQGPPCTWPCSPGKGRDYGYISVKLVKTAKCHRKSRKRPPVVPIFQNGSKKSPLDFLGFPLLLAFSPKELMVPF